MQPLLHAGRIAAPERYCFDEAYFYFHKNLLMGPRTQPFSGQLMCSLQLLLIHGGTDPSGFAIDSFKRDSTRRSIAPRL